MLVLGRSDVEALLDLDRLVDALAEAMAEMSAGNVSMPPRIAARVLERDAILAAMPAFVPSAGALSTKLVSLFPHNRDRPTHQAIVVCFDPATGTPVALLDGEYLTAARTAAGSALATRVLARPDARTLAILGTGVQARAHAGAVTRVRPIDRVKIAGRSYDKAVSLATELEGKLGMTVEASPAYAAALEGAEIVCATTHSPEPVVRHAWLSPGAHVNSVGYNTDGREVDEETVAGAFVVVEARSAALAPPPAGSNDLLWPIRDGVITEDHVAAEIGELVSGRVKPATEPDRITLYKSVGVAVQDAAAAALVLEAARRRNAGTRVEL